MGSQRAGYDLATEQPPHKIILKDLSFLKTLIRLHGFTFISLAWKVKVLVETELQLF